MPSLGVHDLGGRDGFGPVPTEDDAVFSAAADARIFAVTQFSQVAAGFNTDAFRHGIERGAPDRYFELGYWGRWLSNAERMLVEGGVLAPGEVDAVIADDQLDGAEAVRTTDATPPVGRGAQRPLVHPARWSVGQRVRVSATHGRGGHTRIPGYVRGREGTIVATHGGWVYPDAHAHGQGEAPQHVYSVAFSAADVFGTGTHRIMVDLFEPYLEEPS